MPRSCTPKQCRPPTLPAADDDSDDGPSYSPDCETSALRRQLRRQEQMIEKQGQLLYEHAQLICSLQDEVASLRSRQPGGHAEQLSQLTASTLRGLTHSIEQLQRQVRDLEDGRPQDPRCPPSGGSPRAGAGASTERGESASPLLSPRRPARPAAAAQPRTPPAGGGPPQRATGRRTPLQGRSGDGREHAAESDRQSARSRHQDLYDQGMVQMRRREEEIAERRRQQEAKELAQLRSPAIGRGSVRGADKSFTERSSEWKQKRERKRAELRDRLAVAEQSALQRSPSLNHRSLQLAAQRSQQQQQQRGPGAQCERERAGGSAAEPAGAARGDGGSCCPTAPAPWSREPSPQPLPPRQAHSALAAPPDPAGGVRASGAGQALSPPPLDELLERLRRRRELLGIEAPPPPQL
eukprot:TRINITY_DN8672_c0_g1_i1.p1 TRINITY_DN8672_c0_g1~~TRINITY_DN8672_c0_g1_i1.p1  ORF type:complete len:437 (+),score=136.22 TRINITY_DN8672_c0_g1_i1:82-1311(+)